MTTVPVTLTTRITPSWAPGNNLSPTGKPTYLLGKFGATAITGVTVTPVLVSTLGPSTLPFNTTAQAFRVAAGGDETDTVAGAGARKVVVEGLDADGNMYAEELALAGESASAYTDADFWRVQRAYISEVGTYGGMGADAIVIEDETGDDHLSIAATEGQSNFGAFSVPAGYACNISRIELVVQGTREVTFRLFVRNNFTTVTAPGMKAPRAQRTYYLLPQGLHSIDCTDAPITVSALSDVWVMANTAASTSSAAVNIIATLYPLT